MVHRIIKINLSHGLRGYGVALCRASPLPSKPHERGKCLRKFCVFTCKQETIYGFVLGLRIEISFCGGTLRGVCHDSFCSCGSGAEFCLSRQLFFRIRFCARVADLRGKVSVSYTLKDNLRMRAHAASEVCKRHLKMKLRHNSSALFDSHRTKG